MLSKNEVKMEDKVLNLSSNNNQNKNKNPNKMVICEKVEIWECSKRFQVDNDFILK